MKSVVNQGINTDQQTCFAPEYVITELFILTMTTSIIETYGVDLQSAKDYLRVSNNDEDALIEAFTTSSYEQIVAFCNRDFSNATHSINVASSSGYIYLSAQPVASVDVGELREVGAVFYTLLDSVYTGPITYTISVPEYPKTAKIAQLMLINGMYCNRLPQSDVSQFSLDFGVRSLLENYRIINPA